MKNTGKIKPARAGKFEFEKVPSGIKGLDDITRGGLPERPAVACQRWTGLREDTLCDGVHRPGDHRIQ